MTRTHSMWGRAAIVLGALLLAAAGCEASSGGGLPFPGGGTDAGGQGADDGGGGGPDVTAPPPGPDVVAQPDVASAPDVAVVPDVPSDPDVPQGTDDTAGGECCEDGDPCGWAEDGECDCDGAWEWDAVDCDGNTDCCAEGDPCDFAEDGYCDCDGAWAWDAADCGGGECCADGDPCGWAEDGECDCDGEFSWDEADCDGNTDACGAAEEIRADEWESDYDDSCDPGSFWDPDCVGEPDSSFTFDCGKSACSFLDNVCEVMQPCGAVRCLVAGDTGYPVARACPNDPDCFGTAEEPAVACEADGHCDTWCPNGDDGRSIDPDCGPGEGGDYCPGGPEADQCQ